MQFGKDDSARVKGIAIILLCFHHMCYRPEYFSTYNMHTWLPQSLVIELAVLARVCVPIFAFISAYGLATIFNKKKESESAGRFVFKRWITLMAAWWFAYPIQILALYLQGNSLSSVFQGHYQYIFLDFMGWSDFFKTQMLVGINWYMFLAQLVVVLTPLLSVLNKKFRFLSLIYVFLAMQCLGGYFSSNFGGDYVNYLFPIALGNYLATNDVFEKIKVKHKVPVSFGFLALFLGMMLVKYFTSKSSFNFRGIQYVAFGIAIFALCAMTALLFRWDVVLKFLGKYSGNMYFIHIFIVRSTLLHKYVGNVLLLILISLVLSLGISVLIELVKKGIRYDKLIRKIANVGVRTSSEEKTAA